MSDLKLMKTTYTNGAKISTRGFGQREKEVDIFKEEAVSKTLVLQKCLE